MNQFLQKHSRYAVLYLLAGFVLFVVVWFLIQTTDSPANYTAADGNALPAGHPPLSAAASGDTGDFAPDAFNVSQNMKQQLESLRLRVVKTPEDTTHIFRLARMLHDAHQIEEASRYYRNYVALRPQNRQAWLDLSQTLAELKHWDEAEKAAMEMLEQYPNDFAGWYNLGAIYANQSKLDQARSIWQPLTDQQQDLTIAAMAMNSLQRLDAFVKPELVAID